MESASRETRTIRFDVFEVDLVSRELIKRNRKVRIQELPFRFLEALLERPGEIVTREELRKRLWSEATIEFDDCLHTAVRKLRDVLGDSATSPRFIETVPRRGYRFIAAITKEHDAADNPRDVEGAQGTGKSGITAADLLAVKQAERRRARVHNFVLGGSISALAVAIIILIFVTRRSAKPYYRAISDTGEAVPIAAERGVEKSPSLSPDGSRVVFAWSGESGNALNLYVQTVEGTGRVRLTNDQTSDRFPAWSPDGRTIAFVREGEVFSMPAIGGPERRITTALGDGSPGAQIHKR